MSSVRFNGCASGMPALFPFPNPVTSPAPGVVALDRLGSTATLNTSGFPTGGNGLVVMNAEVRTPHVKGLGFVAFVDSGNVFLRAGDINAGEFRSTAGLGLRYRSPLGPLRFDIGFKLDRRDFTGGAERRAVYHLSLGQAF